MYGKTKELIKQLVAELEFVTIPAMDPAHHYVIGSRASEILRGNYETAKDLQHDLKAFYKMLDTYIVER